MERSFKGRVAVGAEPCKDIGLQKELGGNLVPHSSMSVLKLQ